MRKSFTDQEIVEGLQRRTPALTDAIVSYLYQECQPSIGWLVLKNNGTTADSKDLVQEVILAFLENVWQGRFQLRSDTRVKTYIYGIARNQWLKELQQTETRNKRAGWFVQHQHPVDSSPGPDQLVEDLDEVEQALPVFERLGGLCQQILTAYYRDHKTMREIADEFGLGNEANAKVRKYRCLNEWKKLIA